MDPPPRRGDGNDTSADPSDRDDRRPTTDERTQNPAVPRTGHRPPCIATWLGAAALTESGLILGTPAFLAPEQVRGEPVGPTADGYALGLVLLECLTGHREYPGDPVARLDRPPRIPVELPHPVAAALRAMTHPQADRRPHAAQLARYFADLQPLITSHRLGPLPQPSTLSRPDARQSAVPPGAAGNGGGSGLTVLIPLRPCPDRPTTARQRPRHRTTARVAAGLALLLAIGGGVAAVHAARPVADPTASIAATARRHLSPGSCQCPYPFPQRSLLKAGIRSRR